MWYDGGMERFLDNKKGSSEDRDILFWEQRRRMIPPRPADPRSFPESDSRYWYDAEYAGWRIAKHQLPNSPEDGPAGKSIALFLPGSHPYWADYDKGFRREAENHGFQVSIFQADWDQDYQLSTFRQEVDNKPDLIILVPVEVREGSQCIAYAYQRNVPVVCSNQTLEREAYANIIGWTGPDDWGQHRLLARYFAAAVGEQRGKEEGGYCIVSHRPGTSVCEARVWGIITELAKCAPGLKFLEKRFTGFNREASRLTVLDWIDRYGDELVGIISSDDSFPQDGINRALAQRQREDIVRVASGATRRGIGCIKQGTLSAETWQPPELDGELPVKVAADWFKGLRIDPITYLPIRIITRENVDGLLEDWQGLEDFHGEDLARMVLEGRLDEISGFFEDLHRRLGSERFSGEAYFGGIAIDLISILINLSRSKQLNPIDLAGGYDMLYKGLFSQERVSKSLDWLQKFAISIVKQLMDQRSLGGTIVERLFAYIEIHYAEPLSLKTLADEFALTAAYLGRVFKEQTGNTFSRYLNTFRVKKAIDLISRQHITAKEAGLAVGYSDPNYFYTIFKKVTGISPSEYDF